MTIGIYKIENKINHKIYVGQSQHIEKRWQEHCRNSADSVIGRAIQKYGKDNFSFQILEECTVEELDDKEQYYIQLYDSIVPKGYNVEKIVCDRKTNFSHYSEEELNDIINDIKYSDLSFVEISDKYNLDLSTIYYLNRGAVHVVEDEKYPLRTLKQPASAKYCVDCGKEITQQAERCVDCAALKQAKTKPSKDELLNLLNNHNGNFTYVARLYNVSNSAIRKWCQKYNIPHHTSDYTQKKSEKPKKRREEILKPCYMIDKTTNEILMDFPSATAACKYLGKNYSGAHSHIREACEGKREVAYGYKWKDKIDEPFA